MPSLSPFAPTQRPPYSIIQRSQAKPRRPILSPIHPTTISLVQHEKKPGQAKPPPAPPHAPTRTTTSLLQNSRPSRAEPSRAEPRPAEPSRAEPSRADPCRAEPSRAEWVLGYWVSKTLHWSRKRCIGRAELSRAEPNRDEVAFEEAVQRSCLCCHKTMFHFTLLQFALCMECTGSC